MPRVVVADKSYPFAEEDIENRELIAIEKETDLTSVEFFEKLNRGSFIALTALVWILRRRDEPNLAFKDVSFKAAQIEIDDSDAVGKSAPAATAPTSKTRSTTT